MDILNNIQNRLNRIIRKTIYKNKIPKYINVKYINKTDKQYAPIEIDYDNYSKENIRNLIITNHRRMWMWIYNEFYIAYLNADRKPLIHDLKRIYMDKYNVDLYFGCFLCTYVHHFYRHVGYYRDSFYLNKNTCIYCPLDWNDEQCTSPNTPYENLCELDKIDSRTFQYIEKIINLPENKIN